MQNVDNWLSVNTQKDQSSYLAKEMFKHILRTSNFNYRLLKEDLGFPKCYYNKNSLCNTCEVPLAVRKFYFRELKVTFTFYVYIYISPLVSQE